MSFYVFFVLFFKTKSKEDKKTAKKKENKA